MARVEIDSHYWEQDNPGRVRILRPAWVHYGHTDLEKAHQFLLDFGFTECHRSSNPERIFYRGYNDQPINYISEKTDTPQFFGGSLEAASREDLERAAKLPGAGPIRACHFPGGGSIVTIVDPENVPINVIYDYGLVERLPPPKGADAFNKPSVDDEKKPRKGSFQRIPPGPAPIHKLGHFGHKASDIGKMSRWYTTHFNLRAIDVQANPFNKNVDMAVFYNVDLGEKFTDHHSFFHFALFPGQTFPGPHHASFEVHDYDIQQLGHHHLARQKYVPMWGPGRHLLGSQIFDYWYDPDGFTVEHYTDGDVVNRENQPERLVRERIEEYTIWGGAMNFKGAFEGDARPSPVVPAN